MIAPPTAGPWYWHEDSFGRTSIRTPDRGNLIVMDFARKGMQGAEPRFARWTGFDDGVPRGRMGGILSAGLNHPDARLIVAAPDMLELLQEFKRFGDPGQAGGFVYPPGSIQALNEIIAKATGVVK